jgi:ankyrin repeat protein
LIIIAAAQRRRDEMGKALLLASVAGNILDVCRLINRGADVDYVVMVEGVDRTGTPLTEAADMGHADAVRVLISRNADVNKPEPFDGCTALHKSAQEGHVPVMQLLISKGARTDVREKLGKTPLHQAAFYGQQEAAICLLDHGSDVSPSCQSPSHPWG